MVVAINPIPHRDARYSPVNSPAEYARYLDNLASFVSWLIKRNHTVVLFPTQLRADPPVIRDLKTVLQRDESLDLEKYFRVKPTKTLDDVIEQISAADLVVASRFHGVLISFLLQKPVLALSHHPKVSSLMRDMGQSDYILDIDTFGLQAAAERFQKLKSNKDVIRQEIDAGISVNRHRLEAQYSELFRTLCEPTGIAQSLPAKSTVLN